MSAQIILHSAISHAAAADVVEQLDLDVALTRAGNYELRPRQPHTFSFSHRARQHIVAPTFEAPQPPTAA